MIATPCQRNRAHAEVEGEDMDPTKERNLSVSGAHESIAKETLLWGLRPQTPGIYRVDASESKFVAGAQLVLNPSLVLAPESALSLLPTRGLSSAPAARSVSATVFVGNGGMKKGLDSRSAFRHGK